MSRWVVVVVSGPPPRALPAQAAPEELDELLVAPLETDALFVEVCKVDDAAVPLVAEVTPEPVPEAELADPVPVDAPLLEPAVDEVPPPEPPEPELFAAVPDPVPDDAPLFDPDSDCIAARDVDQVPPADPDEPQPKGASSTAARRRNRGTQRCRRATGKEWFTQAQ